MLSNREIAETLRRISELLEAQSADQYRVQAYQQAASSIERLPYHVATRVSEEGAKLLTRERHIGASIAGAIRELVQTGRLGLLDRLEGQTSPEDLFTTLPGIGEELAHRIHEKLQIETLEELELAAHNGRLGEVPGFGPRRVRALQEQLGHVLSHSARRRARLHTPHWAQSATDEPSIAELLRVDARYRELAKAGKLPRVAPRRFNPHGSSWLPILHCHVHGWQLTAMYSNTANAHRLGRTLDWVVLFFERDGHERQCTVVTEYHGPDTGRRVIRGRERECHEWVASREHQQQHALSA